MQPESEIETLIKNTINVLLMPSTGREIFENLVEYPLPQKVGVKDYIFYFVPLNDGYGLGAKNFFQKHYPHHIAKSVSNLEELISVLHTEITTRSLNQVREMVLVCHGNEMALQVPLVADIDEAASPPKHLEYKYLSANSLALLQDDFLNGRRADFAKKRKEVVAKLTQNSWATIRACQFGYARQGLYAFYAFLGGRANVYAPQAWQFFGYSQVGDDKKFESKLEVYEHLSKQRFLKNRQHSPQRVEKIVRQFMNLGRSRTPFMLATQKIRDPITPEMIAYEQLIDELNQRKITAIVRQKCQAEGLELSATAKVSVKELDRHWIINDRVTGADGVAYQLNFHITEELEIIGATIQRSTLQVYVQLAEAQSASPNIPIQLLFLKGENDTWRGYLFDLLAYPDEPGMDAERQKFAQVVALLDSQALTSASANLKELFEAGSLVLSASAVVKVQSDAKKKKWLIEDGAESYLIKQEQSYTDESTLYHSLVVYKHHATRQLQIAHEQEVLAYIGADTDCPGTELMAYLDNYTFEELLSFIEHLRNPYRPEQTIYLHHAYEAMSRKAGYIKWWHQTFDGANDPMAGMDFDLDSNERADKRSLYYDYSPNTYWREVKASQPPKKPFTQDLFLEQKLTARLPPGFDPDALSMESPSSDIDELRRIESLRFEAFFEAEKDLFNPAAQEDVLSCEEFGLLMAALKEHSIDDFDLDKLEDKIRDIIPEANPIWEAVKKAKKAYGMTIGMYKKLKFIFLYLNNPIAFAEGTGAVLAGSEVIFASRLSMVTKVKYIWGALGAMLITEVLAMMVEFIVVSAEAAAAWEQRGMIVGVRTAADQLIITAWHTLLDHTTAPTLETGQLIQMYRPHFTDAELAESHHPFIWAPERYEKGYLAGFKAFEDQANKIFAELDQHLNDLLWEEARLSTCQIMKLRELGLLDFRKLKATIMKDVAYDALNKIQIGKKPPTDE